MTVWYCVNTTPRSEMFLHKRLREKGYDTIHLFYQWTVQRTRFKRGEQTFLLPVFEQYIFASVDPDPDKHQSVGYIRDQRECVGVVSEGGKDAKGNWCIKPIEVHPKFVLQLRQMMSDDSGLCDLPEWRKGPDGRRARFDPGLMIKLISGAWLGHEGVVRLDKGHAIRVAVNVFDREVDIDFPPEAVEPVSRDAGLCPNPAPPKDRDAA